MQFLSGIPRPSLLRPFGPHSSLDQFVQAAQMESGLREFDQQETAQQLKAQTFDDTLTALDVLQVLKDGVSIGLSKTFAALKGRFPFANEALNAFWRTMETQKWVQLDSEQQQYVLSPEVDGILDAAKTLAPKPQAAASTH